MGRNDKEVVVMDKLTRLWELTEKKEALFTRFIRTAERLLSTGLWNDSNYKEAREVVTALQEIVREKVLLDAELLKLTDCQPLLDKVGRELHERYQQKYPITKNTRFLRQPGFTHVYYIIPEEPVMYAAIKEIPPRIDIKRGVAQMETWGMGDWFRIRLAYAPEIDTIFWSEA